MLSYREQRANLRAVTPKAPAYVVLDLNDPRVLAVLGSDQSPATKAAALGLIGDPAEIDQTVPPLGNQSGQRWFRVDIPGGAA